jgi:hypothetical protein
MSTQDCDSATRPRTSSGPIFASRPTSGWYVCKPFLRSLESLSIGSLDQPVQFLGCEHCPLSELEQGIQQDHSQRHHFRKQSLFGGNGPFPFSGACLRQEHVAAPFAQRQTVTLGYSDKLFVFALRHLRTNGSIPQLIGRHDEDLLGANIEETVRPNLSEQNKEVNAERRNSTASARDSLTRFA